MVGSPGGTVADPPLLETKLYVPKWRPGLVSRPTLIDRLDQGAGGKLILVAAPAGFGKTTLLAEWLAAMPEGARPVAWVSLDEGDNDPGLFWAYVILALRRVRSGVGEGALALLRTPQPPPMEAVLTALINDVSAIEHDFSLVLDDFHVIDAPPIHRAVGFLLDHLPRRMHLVIASRSDPPLPLARLRGRADATELRALDLRFTPDEAGSFLNGAMGLGLTAADVATLERRTEGWIAGLQLAALSMRGRSDVAGFVRAFAGDHRYILDYLVEEVLQRQPEPVRAFLLRTSLLDRFSGPLCDAVTGGDDGSAMVEALERGNLFVVPLDDQRRWYRYHHLFAETLRARAIGEEPAEVDVRHRRASDWYERHGFRSDAIRHALNAGDFARAASLVEPAALEMLGSSQEGTLYGWLTALPDEVVRARPVLSVYYAFALLGRGGFDAVDARLRDAERWLGTAAGGRRDATAGEMVVVDEVAFGSLPGTIAIARAYMAGALGDAPGAAAQARRALAVLPEDDHLWRGAGAALLGIAYWTGGELEAAHRSFSEGVARQNRSGHIRFQVAGTWILADIRVAQGRLRDAERTYEQTLRFAMDRDEPVWGTSELYVGLSELSFERDDLTTATDLLLKSKELGEHSGLPETRHRWYVAMARIKEAQGDLEGALDLLDEAGRLYVPNPDPDLRPVSALKARVRLAQGRLTDALEWVRERGLSVDDELSFLREFEHVTLAKVLLGRATAERDRRPIDEAIGLLERLREAAEAGQRFGSAIEILVPLALARAARGDVPRALVPLGRALTLAEPEDYVRVFVGEGEPMRVLLRHAAVGGTATAYVRRLLAAFNLPPPTATPDPAATADPAASLTTREIEILRLIAAGLRNREIADQLFISVPTVKRHIANAYAKLGVGHRTEAVARANGLKLL